MASRASAVLGSLIHGAIVLENRHSIARVDIFRPQVVIVDAHGICCLDIPFRQVVHADQIPAIEVLTKAWLTLHSWRFRSASA